MMKKLLIAMSCMVAMVFPFSSCEDWDDDDFERMLYGYWPLMTAQYGDVLYDIDGTEYVNFSRRGNVIGMGEDLASLNGEWYVDGDVIYVDGQPVWVIDHISDYSLTLVYSYEERDVFGHIRRHRDILTFERND